LRAAAATAAFAGLLGAGVGLGLVLGRQDVLETAARTVERGDLQHFGMGVDQGNHPARQARGAAEQRLGAGAQHHDVGAGAVDLGGEALADADEDADLGQHQQTREGQRDHGGHVATPLVQQCGQGQRHARHAPQIQGCSNAR
jgi:hypothetical protein